MINRRRRNGEASRRLGATIKAKTHLSLSCSADEQLVPRFSWKRQIDFCNPHPQIGSRGKVRETAVETALAQLTFWRLFACVSGLNLFTALSRLKTKVPRNWGRDLWGRTRNRFWTFRQETPCPFSFSRKQGELKVFPIFLLSGPMFKWGRKNRRSLTSWRHCWLPALAKLGYDDRASSKLVVIGNVFIRYEHSHSNKIFVKHRSKKQLKEYN